MAKEQFKINLILNGLEIKDFVLYDLQITAMISSGFTISLTIKASNNINLYDKMQLIIKDKYKQNIYYSVICAIDYNLTTEKYNIKCCDLLRLLDYQQLVTVYNYLTLPEMVQTILLDAHLEYLQLEYNFDTTKIFSNKWAYNVSNYYFLHRIFQQEAINYYYDLYSLLPKIILVKKSYESL